MKVQQRSAIADMLGRFVLGALAEAVIVLDRDGHLVEMNRAARTAPFAGVLRWFNPDARDPSCESFLEQLRGSGRASFKLLRPSNEGRASYLLFEGHAFESWFVIVVRDGSELRELQDELHQLRRVEFLGLAAARITHDLNNVLTPLLYLTRDLAERVDENDLAATLVSEMEAATLRASSMVRDVLGFARRRTPALGEVDVNAVVAGMQTLIDRLLDRKVAVSLCLGDDLPLVRVDRARLEHSILNLVANARNAMPRGGCVTITTSHVVVPAETSSPGGRDLRVVLSVTDSGVGMTDEVRARALDDFFTTSAATGGTGLGLASVRRFVTESGGVIHLDSRLGAGTSVTIELPSSRGGRAQLGAAGTRTADG